MHFQIDRRLDDAGLEALERRRFGGASRGLRLVVRDFLPMVERVERMIEVAEAAGARYAARRDARVDRVPELAHRRQLHLSRLPRVRGRRRSTVSRRPGSSRDRAWACSRTRPGHGSRSRCRWPSSTSRCASGSSAGRSSIVSKTNAETTIHRKARMDYIGVKRVDAGRRGRRGAAADRALHVEGLRRVGAPDPARPAQARVDHAVGGPDRRARTTTRRSSRSSTASPRTSCSRPPHPSCAPRSWRSSGCRRRAGCGSSCGATRCGGRWRPSSPCPRDHVSTELRIRLEHLFELRFGGRAVDYTLSFATDPARFHFTIHVPAGDIPDLPLAELQREVAAAARSWDDSLSDALVATMRRRAAGHELARRYAGPLPRLLQVGGGDLRRPTFDVEQFERLGARPAVRRRAPERAGHRRAADPPQALQDGRQGAADRPPAAARAARPDRRRGGADPPRRNGEDGRYLHDFGVLGPAGKQLDLDRMADIVADTVGAVWEGRAGSDWLNRLVVARPSSTGGGSRSCAPTGSTASCSVRPSPRATRTTASFGTPTSHASWCGSSSSASTRPARRRRGRRGRARRRDRRPTWTPCRASTTTASCAGTWA